ncbi:hypothetical protein ColTof3_01985 [Colletotrichum tofieldiae]|nr:hypothetical protein ColTof3_01985 [Colletotrichum tofieldiae]GKT83793.1 hypothetical protein Ct61P_01643 [Colletotrichum tofieldiae]
MATAISSSRMLLAHRDFSRNLDRISVSLSCNLDSLQEAFANLSRSRSYLDELVPPRNHRDPSRNWRPASSIYSTNDTCVSPVSPNFANVAAANTYPSAAADISPRALLTWKLTRMAHRAAT